MKEEYDQILDDCKLELEDIKKQIEASPISRQVKYLTAYAVVRSSGAIEVTMKQMEYDWLIIGANTDAQEYLYEKIVKAATNPATDRMCEFLGRINPDKNKKFKRKLHTHGEERDKLNSLVKLRNAIAHGDSISSGINDVVSYFSAGRIVLQLLYSEMIGR